MHILEHLRTVNRHRHLVRKYCFRLGLYWQGLTHDLSKYSPTEFWRSAKYYQGYRSPNDQERLVNGVSLSWLHQGAATATILNIGSTTAGARTGRPSSAAARCR